MNYKLQSQLYIKGKTCQPLIFKLFHNSLNLKGI
nr:MAG TPA: hypothetical protein [Caudoviricetes sp.]